jgi:hypothetical protein
MTTSETDLLYASSYGRCPRCGKYVTGWATKTGFVPCAATHVCEPLQGIDTRVQQPQQAGNRAGTNFDGEPKPCPFCGAALEHRVELLTGQRVWIHPENECMMRGTQLRWPNDLAAWNRRISTTSTDARHTGRATREELVEALRSVYEMERADYVVQYRKEMMEHIRDILSREESDERIPGNSGR